MASLVFKKLNPQLWIHIYFSQVSLSVLQMHLLHLNLPKFLKRRRKQKKELEILGGEEIGADWD